jgi:hypothetical protein
MRGLKVNLRTVFVVRRATAAAQIRHPTETRLNQTVLSTDRPTDYTIDRMCGSVAAGAGDAVVTGSNSSQFHKGDLAMPNYLVLSSGGSKPASEAEGKAVMAEWMAWANKVGDGLVDGGNPTTPNARTIQANGKVSDVPAGSMVTAYMIIKADSLDAAMAMVKDCPVLKRVTSISVFETFAM